MTCSPVKRYYDPYFLREALLSILCFYDPGGPVFLKRLCGLLFVLMGHEGQILISIITLSLRILYQNHVDSVHMNLGTKSPATQYV